MKNQSNLVDLRWRQMSVDGVDDELRFLQQKFEKFGVVLHVKFFLEEFLPLKFAQYELVPLHSQFKDFQLEARHGSIAAANLNCWLLVVALVIAVNARSAMILIIYWKELFYQLERLFQVFASQAFINVLYLSFVSIVKKK